MVHSETVVDGKMKNSCPENEKYIKYENTPTGVMLNMICPTGSWMPIQNGKPEYLPLKAEHLWNTNNLYHRIKLAKCRVKPSDDDVLQDMYENYMKRMFDTSYISYAPNLPFKETIKLVYESVYQNYYYHSLTPSGKAKYKQENADPEPRMEHEVPLSPDVAEETLKPPDAVWAALAHIGHATVTGWLRETYRGFRNRKLKYDQVSQVEQFLKFRHIKYRKPHAGNGHYLYLLGCPICGHRKTTTTYLRHIPGKNVWLANCENPKCDFTIPNSGNFLVHKKKFRLEWFLACALVLTSILKIEDQMESGHFKP